MSKVLLSSDEWLRLEEAVRNAVAMGGIAAMGYYREALYPVLALDQSRNPSTEADVQATAAILRSLDSGIAEAVHGRFGRTYFAEELTIPAGGGGSERRSRMEEVVAGLGAVTQNVARTRKDFIDAFPTAICALIDGIDGTTSFRAGIPLFCCAVALFIHGIPRIGAIYDPIHHTVYYGSVRSEFAKERESGSSSNIWQIRSGSHARLPLRPKKSSERPLVGTHLTRSDPEAFREAAGILPRVANKTGGVYMLNSGQLALAYVASGSLSAFYNNYTNVWDTAAGEVLVKAAGGHVTSFDGGSINYSDQSEGARKVKIVAALDISVQRMLQGLLR